jgi:peroxiredoxin
MRNEEMTIQSGDKLPSATLRRMGPNGIESIATDDYFAGRKVVVFALPGAFTPTCSAKHLPGFLARAEEFKAKGVDAIACLSVNDAFVMGAWGKDQGVGEEVAMLADGNAEFSDALGLSYDASAGGMGRRSRRYAMIVEDGVVTTLKVEEPGAFEVSSAEAMLAEL